MTFAPASILAARALIKQHTRLADAALGIVGDAAHRGGYHCGRDRTVTADYSVVESSRDAHPSDAASALDVGWFDMTVAGKRHTLRSFSLWLVAQCQANAPDAADIREVIYSADGETVKRWDRLRKRSSGDSSHRWHTHISFHRDSEGRDKTALFRRYFVHIGAIAGAPPAPSLNTGPGGDMPTPKDLLDFDDVPNPYGDAAANPKIQVRTALKAAASVDVKVDHMQRRVDDLHAKVDALTSRLDQLAAKQASGGVDPAAIAAQIADNLRGRLEQ